MRNARGEIRTRTGLPPVDFESTASAVPPLGRACKIYCSAKAVTGAVARSRGSGGLRPELQSLPSDLPDLYPVLPQFHRRILVGIAEVLHIGRI